MRWLKKREFMVYAYLALKYGGERVSFPDAVFEVREAFKMSAGVAKNVLKRLMRSGYVTKVDKTYIKVRELEDLLSEHIASYIHGRARRAGRRGPRGLSPRGGNIRL